MIKIKLNYLLCNFATLILPRKVTVNLQKLEYLDICEPTAPSKNAID